MKIQLTNSEWANCVYLGYEQYRLHRQAGNGHLWDDPEKGWNDALSKGAEFSVVKVLGGSWDDWEEGRRLGPSHWAIKRQVHDYKHAEIRSTSVSGGSLIVYDNDHDSSPYVLVNTGEVERTRVPIFDLVGWMFGGEAKNPLWWRAHARRPAFFVYPSRLRKMEQLLALWPNG